MLFGVVFSGIGIMFTDGSVRVVLSNNCLYILVLVWLLQFSDLLIILYNIPLAALQSMTATNTGDRPRPTRFAGGQSCSNTDHAHLTQLIRATTTTTNASEYIQETQVRHYIVEIVNGISRGP
jgi:hypothetical protein